MADTVGIKPSVRVNFNSIHHINISNTGLDTRELWVTAADICPDVTHTPSPKKKRRDFG